MSQHTYLNILQSDTLTKQSISALRVENKNAIIYLLKDEYSKQVCLPGLYFVDVVSGKFTFHKVDFNNTYDEDPTTGDETSYEAQQRFYEATGFEGFCISSYEEFEKTFNGKHTSFAETDPTAQSRKWLCTKNFTVGSFEYQANSMYDATYDVSHYVPTQTALPVPSAVNDLMFSTLSTTHITDDLNDLVSLMEAESDKFAFLNSSCVLKTPLYTKGWYEIVEDEENPGTYVWSKKQDASCVLIEAHENTTVNEESVPLLTDDQVTLAYNSYVEGKPVLIKDAATNYFVLENADAVTEAGETTINVRVLFEDKMVLTYSLNSEVVITYKEIGGGILRAAVLPEISDSSADFVEVDKTLYWKRTTDVPYSSKAKKDDYLYEFDYDKLDDEFGYSHIINNDINGACSAVRNGNFFGRNFDWIYDEEVSAVVNTSHITDRFKSISVCGGFPKFDKAFVESGKTDEDIYKLLPYFVQTGINENGVFVSINTVPRDKGEYVRTKTAEAPTKTIPMAGLLRYILDYAESASQICNEIKKNIVLTASRQLATSDYTVHYMIGDETNQYILEVLPNGDGTFSADYHEPDVSKSPYDNYIMTNFYVNDIVFKVDGSVYTPATQTASEDAMNYNLITEKGQGLERYNLIVSKIEDITTKDEMIELMHELDYRRMYNTLSTVYPDGIWGGLTEAEWHTEFTGEDNLKVNSAVADFADIEDAAGALFIERTRNGLTWHTVHSAVINIESRIMTIFSSSESETAYEFSL